MDKDDAVHMNLMYTAIENWESDEDDIYGRSATLYFDNTSTFSYIGKRNYKEWYKHKTTIKNAKPTKIEPKEIICCGNLYTTLAYIDLTIKNLKTRYPQSNYINPNSVIQGRFYIIDADYDATFECMDFEGTNSFKFELDENLISTTRNTKNSVFFCYKTYPDCTIYIRLN